MMSDENTREGELRRLAERQGLTLRQAPEGEPGGYQLVTSGADTTITGDDLTEYTLSLDDVEALLTNDELTPQAETVQSPHHTRRASKDSDTRTT